MSSRRTLITEVVTGLGTIPSWTLRDLSVGRGIPTELRGVLETDWSALRESLRDEQFESDFEAAFESGRYFLSASDGLRGRPPKLIEWKGRHQSPEHDPLPADVRIDHVFALSCKFFSKILLNPSPLSLFRYALVEGAEAGRDWFHEAAPRQYERLLGATADFLGLRGIPRSPLDLTTEQRLVLKNAFRRWPAELESSVNEFVVAVSDESSRSLNRVLTDLRARERFYWRLLRIHSSPYFMIGAQASGPVRLRVLTPWDFRRRFEFRGFEVAPEPRGQAQVRWTAELFDRELNEIRVTEGHIEIRWSHGRFNKSPEGKVYLDTPHNQACGYSPI